MNLPIPHLTNPDASRFGISYAQEFLNTIPSMTSTEFEQTLQDVRSRAAAPLSKTTGFDVTAQLANKYFPISQAIVLDPEEARRIEKGEKLTSLIRQEVHRILQENPLDGHFRHLLLSFLHSITPESTIDGPVPLAYRILPPGEGFVPAETAEGKEGVEYPVDHPRVEWALDIAKTFDTTFKQSQHFFVSHLDTAVPQKPYHAILFPAFGRCFFVCNSYGNATYIVPIDQWEDWAKDHKIEDLRQAATVSRQDPKNPRVSWFPMQKDETSWRDTLVSELLANPAQEPSAIKTAPKRKSFEDWLELLVRFYLANGQWPSRSAQAPDEKRLYSQIHIWRNGFRNEQLLHQGLKPTSTNRLSNEHMQLILAVGITLDTATEADRLFQTNLNSVISFFQRLNRWPSQSSEDSEEKRLGTLIKEWQRAFRNESSRTQGEITKSDSRLSNDYMHQLLTAGIVLDTASAFEQNFQKKLKTCLSFFQQHNRWPSQKSKNPEERKLYAQICAWREGFRNEQLLKQKKDLIGRHRLSEDRARQLIEAGIIREDSSEKKKESE